MKIIELLDNIQIALTNEEADVLGKFHTTKKIAKEDLDPRQILLANQLVNKNILLRSKTNGKLYYSKKI